VSGDESVGRFAVSRNKKHVQKALADPAAPTSTAADNGRFVVEIDCQLFELRCARARVQALESDIAMDKRRHGHCRRRGAHHAVPRGARHRADARARALRHAARRALVAH
jgi:hypothetical protein